MVKGAAIFFLVALAAAMLGFTAIAGAFVFICLMLIVLGLFAVRTA